LQSNLFLLLYPHSSLNRKPPRREIENGVAHAPKKAKNRWMKKTSGFFD